MGWYDRQRLVGLELPNPTAWTSLNSCDDKTTYANFQGDQWVCPKCGQVENRRGLVELERTLSQLAQRIFKISMSGHPSVGSGSGNASVPLVKDNYISGALQLACDVAAVFGPRHWAWKWGVLFSIDLDLSYPSFCGTTQHRSTVEYREWIILSLLDIWDWMGSLDISQEPGCYLHTRAKKALALCDDFAKSHAACIE